MFNKKIKLFSLFGFSVGMDITWLILGVLISWSLAEGVFPRYAEGLPVATYWLMGIAGALGLLVSIVFHEFCHSLIARRFGLPMKGITLFIFGGVAEMEEEPANPKVEFLMAIAGPIASFVLSGVLFGIFSLGRAVEWPVTVTVVLGYLAVLNIILAIFNMLPAFPLDGGRILRSILWSIKGDLRWATRVCSAIGAGFGLVLIGLGVLNVIDGSFISGLWYVLIGIFIRAAAHSSYHRLVIRNALEGEPVSRFMKADPITVPPDTSLNDMVTDYFYKYHHKMFPVSENGHLQGCITSAGIKTVPKHQWAEVSVGQVAEECSDRNVVSPDTDAMKALSLMSTTGNSRLMVVQAGQLLGVVTLKDLLGFLAMKIDLEG